MQIKQESGLKWPQKLRTPLEMRDPTRYCEFHEDQGHTTDDCWELRRQIEYLLQEGKLRRFILEHGAPHLGRARAQGRKRSPQCDRLPANIDQGGLDNTPLPPPPHRGEVRTIIVRPYLKGSSKRAQKHYMCEAQHQQVFLAK